ncbi:MAG: RC-LH1 core complex protein PufX [Pseudomonadota bacterium]
MNANDDSPYGSGKIDKSTVFKDVGKQMCVGAGVAAAVILVPAALIYVTYLIGTLLPPESKEADDPTPDSFSYYYEQPYEAPEPRRIA